MAKKRNAAKKASDFPNGSKQKYMDYPHGSTQDSVCQQSSFTKRYQAKKREAQETGWSFGKDILSFNLRHCQRIIRKAGLSCWIDKDSCLYGPTDEADKAIATLANAGDRMSKKILEKFGQDNISGEAHE